MLAEDLVTVPVALRFSNHSFVQKVFAALGKRVALLAAAPLHQPTAQRDERRLLPRLRKAPACPPRPWCVLCGQACSERGRREAAAGRKLTAAAQLRARPAEIPWGRMPSCSPWGLRGAGWVHGAER